MQSMSNILPRQPTVVAVRCWLSSASGRCGPLTSYTRNRCYLPVASPSRHRKHFCLPFSFVFLVSSSLSLSLFIYLYIYIYISNFKPFLALCLLSPVPSICRPALRSLFVIPPPSHAADPLIHSLAPCAVRHQLSFNAPTFSPTLMQCVCVHVCAFEGEILFWRCLRCLSASHVAAFHIRTVALLQQGYKLAYIAFLISEHKSSAIKIQQRQTHCGGFWVVFFVWFLLFQK